MSECKEVLANENKGRKICGLIPGQLVKPGEQSQPSHQFHGKGEGMDVQGSGHSP